MSTGNACEIVEASMKDIPRLARLFEDYRAFYGESPASAAAHDFVTRQIGQQLTKFFIARDDGDSVAGFMHLLPSTNTLAMRPIWILEDLFVLPEARRRGVAEALLLYAEKFARKTGAERLTLSTAHDNHAAQALYTKLGWVREERFWHFHRLF